MTFFPWRTKLRLVRSLVTKDQPVYVQFYVTARCNLACEQCNIIYSNADVTEIPIEGVRKIAENLDRIGVSIVLLTGGEPFARRDLPQIVAEFARRNIHVRIQTNGLATREALTACRDAGAKDISISLDSLQPDVQDRINGEFAGSWSRAVDTLALVNDVFPADSFAALGCVMAPRNLEFIPDLIRFATGIGWFVSLVPAHTAPQHRPAGFRSLDETCRFQPVQYQRVKEVLDEVRRLRESGHLLYDSEPYLEDMLRFVRGEPVRWRKRNDGVCDSPNLYFAILPNGRMSVCCDLRMNSDISAAAPDFPERFNADATRDEARGIAAQCGGCLYGSFPEMTITARWFRPLMQRALFFNTRRPGGLARMSPAEMHALAGSIRDHNRALYAGPTAG